MIRVMIVSCISILPLLSFAKHNETCGSYSIWEAETKRSFKTRHLDFHAQIAELIADLSTGRPYGYELIREKIGQPPVHAPRPWFEKILELSEIFSKNKGRMVPADEDSANLIARVKESVGFTDDIIPVAPVSAQDEAGFSAGLRMTDDAGKSRAVYLLGIPQIGSVFQGHDHFVLLHEFGHFSHGDFNPFEVEARKQNVNVWLDAPEVRADVEYVSRFSQMASEFVTTCSALGQRIVAGLAKRKAASHDSCSQESAFDPYQVKERRADLFAARHLLAENKIAAILETIDSWSKGDAEKRCEPGSHPPEFERSLYLTGFLINNGIDVNELFARWQRSAICEARSSIGDSLFGHRPTDPASVATRQYRQAFRSWVTDNTATDYEGWKAAHAGLDGGTSSFELQLENACQKLEINPLDEGAQRAALFNYNYMRELRGLPPRTCFQEIGKRELFEFRFEKWKDKAEKEFGSNRFSLQEYASHMRVALEGGTMLREDPQQALMSYNYLRHLGGQSLVYSVEFISLEWIMQLLR